MKALITLAAALALALPALTAQANELAGIKFGMSLTEAKSSLMTNAKGLKMLSVSNNGIENGIYGYTEKAERKIKEHFLWDEIADRFIEVYRKCITDK